ncbi:MAG: hypothetical protein B6I20_02185 [Bacteroidetes bacterium 4572_117]|nr:MAG: hypothetical protein B6I20_02185 [Bacteroidetes bacterium 4572_117]
MKKILTFIVLVFLSTNLFAGQADGDFVVTKEKAYFVKHLRFGISSFLIGTMENGEKVKFAKEDVLVYKKNGERFEKMPVVKNSVCTDDYCFMQVVAFRNGLKVYKHCYTDLNGELTSRHYIFKKDKFVVKFNSTNKETLTAFFEGK